MIETLKILHLEDIQADSELVERQLKKADIAFETLLVDNKTDFIRALKEFSPDLILSDHSLASFDSQEALKIVKEMGITVPFILVTATVSEEYAVTIMKEGAWDYILKDRLQRLPSAVSNSITKYNLEAESKQADETLRSSEQKYKLLFECNPMPMFMMSISTHAIIDVNEAATIHYGYSKAEFLEKKETDLRPEKDIKKFEFATIELPYMRRPGICQHKKKDGTIIMVDIIAHDVMYKDEQVRLILANDVTEKLHAEAELANQLITQQKLITETSIQVQEREREEIGKELHDNINQILTSTKLYLEMAIKSEEDLRPQLLHKSCDNVNLVIAEIRQLSQTLVAPSLGNITLKDAITELIGCIRNASALKLELKITKLNEDLMDKKIKLMFYRIVQEQINNILKHSRAKNVIIQLCVELNDIVLTVKDDGIGFDTNKISGGIGLRNITNRAGFYNGITQLISAPGKGCTLKVTIPVN